MIIIEKQAKWIGDGFYFHCSNCGNEPLYKPSDCWASDIEYVVSDYCPYCGAHMIEDEEVKTCDTSFK